MRKLFAIAVLAFCASAQASVIQYDFNYALTSGESISGSLLGELQGDGDTINIVELLGIAYSDPNIATHQYLDPWESNTVSLSGDTLEFRTNVPFAASPNGLIWFDGTTVRVFEFFYDPIAPDLQGAIVIDGGTLDASAWTITAIPVPAAAWLFGSALAGLGWLRRKQH